MSEYGYIVPDSIFKKLNEEFNFDMDVYADKYSTKCEKFLTREYSLRADWNCYMQEDKCVVWCAPPTKHINAYVLKALFESSHNNVEVVMLLPSRTDTTWFHNIYGAGNTEIRFLRGRILFEGSYKKASCGSLIAIFKPIKVDPFDDIFNY